MDIKEVEKVVRRIQRRLFKNSNSYSIGMLKSRFRGSGLQFKEHQIYCYGDDVRFIDWKLYAKSNTPYIKTFEEERNIEIIVFIDLSLSMLMGYKGLTKLQAAVNIACLISLLVKETNDYIQIVLLGSEGKILPKANGRKAIIHLVGELRKINIMKADGTINISYRPQNLISHEEKLNIINRFVKQKKEVVILSDFDDFLKEEDLRQLSKNRKNHCFRIISPIDKGQKTKFNIHCFNASNISSVESRMISLNTWVKDEDGAKHLPINIKNLDIEKRYMEDFVKELV